VSVLSIDNQTKYPQTISVLQTACQHEKAAVRAYLAYSRKALSENYPNIGYLLETFAASESIHARNSMQLLSNLGVNVKEPTGAEILVSSTKKNLKSAAEMELKDVDTSYPLFIEQITPEGHEAAIKLFVQTLASEKQHRALIEKIGSGTGIFFGFLARTIESKIERYFVCQVCGALASTPLKEACPICHTTDSYREVQRATQASP
jgi:rubrerythrin